LVPNHQLVEQSIAHKEEELMMKDCAMEYRPGKRHWYKLKRDYLDGMADLVLLGASFFH